MGFNSRNAIHLTFFIWVSLLPNWAPHPRIKTFVIGCWIQMQKGKKWGPSLAKPAPKPWNTVTMVLQKDKRGRWQVGRMEGSDVKQTDWWTQRTHLWKGTEERETSSCHFCCNFIENLIMFCTLRKENMKWSKQETEKMKGKVGKTVSLSLQRHDKH